MRAFALVQGPRRKFIAVSESTIDLWIKGAFLLGFKGEDSTPIVEYARHCKAAGMSIVRADVTLGDPITMPRKR